MCEQTRPSAQANLHTHSQLPPHPSRRPYKVFRHQIGRPASEDVCVYEETDEAFYVGIVKSRSEEIIFICSGEQQLVTADS